MAYQVDWNKEEYKEFLFDLLDESYSLSYTTIKNVINLAYKKQVMRQDEIFCINLHLLYNNGYLKKHPNYLLTKSGQYVKIVKWEF